MRISSSPKRPFFAAVRIERGDRDARAARCRSRCSVASASSTAGVMRSGVIMSTASRSATCEVTRNVANSSITFISPKKPSCCVSAANIWCSSWNFQPPRCSARLVERREADAVELAGQREIDHVLQRVAGEPAGSGETSPRLIVAGIDVAEVDERHFVARPVDRVDVRVASPVEMRRRRRRQPSSSTRASPMTTMRATSA